jgi:Trypsin
VTGPQTCLCVPAGKCLAPPGPPAPPVPPPTGSIDPVPPPPENHFGEGLIDIRIVNKVRHSTLNPCKFVHFFHDKLLITQPPAGVRCADPTFQYCCANNAFPPAPLPPPKFVGTCGTAKPIPTPAYALDPTQAKFGEFPWMVVILGPTNNYVGGGVLITPKHVLTAAHKIYNIRYDLVLSCIFTSTKYVHHVIQRGIRHQSAPG